MSRTMDRMTRKTELGNYVLKSCVDCKYKDECGGYDVDCEYYLVRELGRLEDKIESGELVDSKENHLILLSRGNGKSFMRLEVIEILTKYKNGTLIELPCKVGDTAYYETFKNGESKGIKPHKVIGFVLEVMTQNIDGFGCTAVPIKDFGESAFLTKAEAEAKLKELEEKENENVL